MKPPGWSYRRKYESSFRRRNCRKRFYGGRRALRHPQKPHKARSRLDLFRGALFGGGGVYHQPREGRAPSRHQKSPRGRRGASLHHQQRQRQHLQCQRGGDRGADLELARKRAWHQDGRRGGRLHRRHRSTHDHRPLQKGSPPPREGSFQGRLPSRGGSHHDHRHRQKGSCGQL